MAKLAFVFPGQGSQEVGMLQDMSGTQSLVSETFAEASAVLGYDLWELIQQGPAEQLNRTEFTQPALLTASVALWRVAQQQGLVSVDLVAGHSLGEYSALVAAGVVEFGDAVRLVQQRGQFMQSAVPVGVGGMAAVLGLDDDKVSSICRTITAATTGDGVVQAANYNSPGQVVIAGTNDALAEAIDACKAAGAKRAMALSVSAPFHSTLMQPAADKMAEALAGINFQVSSIDIIQNVDAQYCSDPALIRENLVKQMYSAVRWTESVQRMAADGVTVVVECGPGKVLSGLNRRIDKSLRSHSINSAASLESVCQELSQ
jgi:[acyl-carrier-protein] S-malonyltransferase